jgi:thiamine-phosphate pyrophosphorylase
MLVTDRQRVTGRLEDAVAAAVAGGVNAVQLREHDLHAGELLRLARNLRAVTRGAALLLVNDRLDVALASGADGVHLPETGMPPPEARWIAGPELIIGRSVHSPAGAREAEQTGADYVVVGTVYPTGSHPGESGAGPELIRAAAEVRLPVIAIGGITPANARAVMQAGASGVAVISALLGAPQVERAARELWAALQ